MINIKGTVVLQDGDEIGSIDGDTCTMSVKVGPAIKGQVRKAAKNPNLAFELTETKPAAKKASPADTSYPAKAEEQDAEVFDDGKKRIGIERLFHAVKFGKIEAPPATHPAMGKVTPVFVEWAEKHLTSDEFEREYGSRKLPTVEQFEKAEGVMRNPNRKIKFNDGITTETEDTEA